MRERFRTEVRQIAGAMAFETVMRYGDALARSPHAERTMETTARRVAAEVAGAIADERVVQADEIVRAAASAAGDTAIRAARKVAGKTAATLAAEAEATTLKKAHEAVEEELKDAWEALEEAREEVTRSAVRFARDEAVRAVAETVAETVPPIVEVRVAGAPGRVRVGGHTHTVFPDVLLALGAGCQVLLVGPAGTGKSMMARQAAEAFGQEFHALSLGPTTRAGR